VQQISDQIGFLVAQRVTTPCSVLSSHYSRFVGKKSAICQKLHCPSVPAQKFTEGWAGWLTDCSK
jgi:hypothetical protein